MTTPTYASPEEVAKQFDELFSHTDTCSTFCSGECNQAHTHFDEQDCNCVKAKFKSFIATQRREDLEAHKSDLMNKVVERYGEKGKMSGSFGYQGIQMGITAYQTEKDEVRDTVLDMIEEYFTTLLAQDKK